MFDTIVAVSTPPGVGAIGLVRISGPEAIDLVQKIFRGKNLSQLATHQAAYGIIRDGDDILDEVVATVFRAPHSYTKEDTVELSCHGSPYILDRITKLLIHNGCRYAQPGEFTQRAFLNGRFDLAQAEAVADLIEADSYGAHQVAIKQLRGGLSDEINQLREKLIHFAALLELELDFSDEDVEFADRSALQLLVQEVLEHIQPLIQSFKYGNAVKKGVTTVIAGRPNAGKSTLLNALLKEERAIVSDIAGTTRDTIEEIYHIENIAFRLVDTAGIREATDTIEKIGVQKTLEKVQQATILLYVFDVVETTVAEALKDIEQLYQKDVHLIIVANKADIAPDHLKAEIFNHLPQPSVLISSKFGHQLPTLEKLLLQTVKQHNITDKHVITNIRHYDALVASKNALEEVLNGIKTHLTHELLAFHLKDALRSLGNITGQIDVDKDILGAIFSKFCIGK